MVIFLIILLMISFFGVKVAERNKFFSDYISKQKTTAVNGVFTVLVFLSHASGYIELSGALDSPYIMFKNYMRQMVVATFLFYSGFGIAESVKKKGMGYIKSIPSKRFFRVLYHAWIAVALFIIAGLALKKTFSLKQIVLSFTFWTSVGNSNWYIFVILCLYLIVFSSFFVTRANKYAGTAVTTVLSLALVYMLIKAGKESWWYNTVILYPVGMMFSLVKEKFDKIVMKNDLCYLAVLGACVFAYYIFQKNSSSGIAFYSLWGIMFMVLVILLSMKISINNRILEFFGSHVFSIYILQRIPMMVFQKLELFQNRYIFVVLSFVATVIIAMLFDAVTDRLDKLIYTKRKA